MKYASVYLRRAAFIIDSMSKTSAGVWIGTGVPVVLKDDAADAELGAAVLEALGRSREGIPHPKQDEWPEIANRLLRVAKVKSWSGFAQRSRSLGIEETGGAVTFLPERNEGPRGGFTPIKDAGFSLPADSLPEAIGAAVRKGLQLSE